MISHIPLNKLFPSLSPYYTKRPNCRLVTITIYGAFSSSTKKRMKVGLIDPHFSALYKRIQSRNNQFNLFFQLLEKL